MTRRSFQHATPRPWVVCERVGDLIPLRTTREPIRDACLVPVNGNLVEAEATAALIASWSASTVKGRKS